MEIISALWSVILVSRSQDFCITGVPWIGGVDRWSRCLLDSSLGTFYVIFVGGARCKFFVFWSSIPSQDVFNMLSLSHVVMSERHDTCRNIRNLLSSASSLYLKPFLTKSSMRRYLFFCWSLSRVVTS